VAALGLAKLGRVAAGVAAPAFGTTEGSGVGVAVATAGLVGRAAGVAGRWLAAGRGVGVSAGTAIVGAGVGAGVNLGVGVGEGRGAGVSGGGPMIVGVGVGAGCRRKSLTCAAAGAARSAALPAKRIARRVM
jgi:hypothetical protein